ncbi:MAG: hypothetical protein ACK2UL_00075, partial [Anaerolineae bacterium]
MKGELRFGAAGIATGPEPVGAAPLSQPTTSLTYELAETWSERPRAPIAGRYLAPLDISSAQDETIYVLDTPYEGTDREAVPSGKPALHAQRPDGAPIAMLGLAPTLGAALRLDVAFDDAPHVLGRLGAPNGPWGVVRLAPDGSVTHSFALATAGRPADVAVAPDGRIYVSMSTVTGGLDQIDIYDVDGVLLGSIKPAEMGPQGLDQRFTYELFKLDIAADGTVYVIALAWRECPPDGPNPPRTPPPPPTPTPRPSLFGFEDDLGGAALDGALDAPDQDDDFPCEKEIVLVFEPDNTFREEIPNPHTADIAVGPSGVFVSTDEPFRRTGQRIYELGADEATFSYRTPRRLDIPASISAAHMQLDVAA